MAGHTVLVELYYGVIAQWNPVPVYARDPVTIVRGRSDETSDPTASTATLTIDNRSGDYNPLNPLSPLYGLAGRYTPIRITVDGVLRFHGEVASWKPRRSAEFTPGTGRGDRWVQIEAAGPLRRLEQGKTPARSALYRKISRSAAAVYWPMEEPKLALQAADAMGGAQLVYSSPLGTAGVSEFPFGADGPPGGGTIPDLTAQGAAFQGLKGPIVTPLGSSRNQWMAQWVQRAEVTGPLYAAGVHLAYIFASGSVPVWDIRIGSTTQTGTFTVQAKDDSFAVIATINSGVVVLDSLWHHCALYVRTAGADLAVKLYLDGTQVASTTLVGQASSIGFLNIAAAEDSYQLRFGHLYLTESTSTSDGALTVDPVHVQAMNGHWGETGAARLARLAAEQGETLAVVGGGSMHQMGAQGIDSFPNLLREVEHTDDGILCDERGSLGLLYKSRGNQYSQPATLALDYATPGQVAQPLDAAMDDLYIRNDVTVKHKGGSEVRRTLETGPLSVAPPPNGIGRIDTTIEVNVAFDSQLPDLAGWHLAKGTTGAVRYPRVTVDLDTNPGLAAAAVAADVGHVLTVAHTEEGGAALLILGYTEVIGPHKAPRLIIFTCTPAAPWAIATVESNPPYEARVATLTATVNGFHDGFTTSLSVATTGNIWTTTATLPADFPFDLDVEGEQITVTAISGSSSPQTFTVTRSINGIVKAHNPGAPVRLWQATRVGL